MLSKEEINQILDNGLGKIGAVSGAIGGAVGPKPGVIGMVAGAAGAKTGTRFASHLLPTDNKNDSIQIKNAEKFPELFKQYLGNSLIIENKEKEMYYAAGVKGSGILNLNPCVIEVTLNQNTLTISAHAKEGLIKQKTCLKAISQLKMYLEEKSPR